jgi:hypothetical protein
MSIYKGVLLRGDDEITVTAVYNIIGHDRPATRDDPEEYAEIEFITTKDADENELTLSGAEIEDLEEKILNSLED